MPYAIPAAPSRTLFNVQGASRAAFNGAQFYHQGDIKLELKPTVENIHIEGLRSDSRRVTDRVAKLSLTPEGLFSDSVIAALWPYLASPVGTLIIGDADVPLVLHGRNADLATILSAAVHKMPDIIFDVKKTIVGSADFIGVLASGKLPTDADAYHTYAGTGGTFNRANFNTGLIKTQRYTLSVGTADGFVDIDTQDGIHFSPSLTVEACMIPGLGTLTYRVAKLEASLKFKPFGPSIAQALALLNYQGANAGIGGELNSQGLTVVITGADGIPYLTIPNATLQDGELVYGDKPLRQGELQFYCSTGFNNDGSEQALAVLSAAAITISLNPTSLAGGKVGTVYSKVVAAFGGIAPYTFTKTAGDLPDGLALSGVGVLSGTPTNAGSFTFTVTATDYLGNTGTLEYTVVIAAE